LFVENVFSREINIPILWCFYC